MTKSHTQIIEEVKKRYPQEADILIDNESTPIEIIIKEVLSISQNEILSEIKSNMSCMELEGENIECSVIKEIIKKIEKQNIKPKIQENK